MPEIWSLDRAGDLIGLYNTRMETIPYAYPVSADVLMQGAQARSEGIFENECLVVGLERATPKAFAQIADLIPLDPEGIPEEYREFFSEGGGLIRMFVAHPKCLGTAQDVLSKVEEIFRGRGQEKIWAFDDSGYHFYRYGSAVAQEHWPMAWLTDYQQYALSLFGLNRYDMNKKGMCLHLPNYELALPRHEDSELQIRLTPQDGNLTRPNLTVEVIRDAAMICRVKISSLEFSTPYQSQACCVDGFGTVEPERRKGIGRYAMEVALSEMHKLGYKHAVLDVENGNYPAQLLYLSMGFQVLSNTYSARKTLV